MQQPKLLTTWQQLLAAPFLPPFLTWTGTHHADSPEAGCPQPVPTLRYACPQQAMVEHRAARSGPPMLRFSPSQVDPGLDFATWCRSQPKSSVAKACIQPWGGSGPAPCLQA